jgi:hypothetical protein
MATFFKGLYAQNSARNDDGWTALRFFVFRGSGQRLRLFRLLEKKMPLALSFLRCATPNHFCCAKGLALVPGVGVRKNR